MASPYQAPYENARPRRRVWPFVLSGCAVMGIAALAACGGLLFLGYKEVAGGGEVAAEFDRLFQEIHQGQAAEFYRRWASPLLKRTTSEEAFVKLAASINDRLGRLESKDVREFSAKSVNLTTSLDATYQCRFERGQAKVKTRFIREGNRWLLDRFSIESPRLLQGAVQMVCPSCGKRYESGDRFCPHCGAKLKNGGPAEKSENEPDVDTGNSQPMGSDLKSEEIERKSI